MVPVWYTCVFIIQLVEYLKDKKITIEIWGRQAATSGADSDLNTQELMMKDKSRFGSPAKNVSISINEE